VIQPFGNEEVSRSCKVDAASSPTSPSPGLPAWAVAENRLPRSLRRKSLRSASTGTPVTCIAPQAAEELLRAEGFTDIRYVVLQEVRAQKIGHAIMSVITDRPWSQYCLFATSTKFAQKYPVATKRVLRAILKAVDLCTSDPARVAQLMVDRGYAARYDYALQALSEIRYDVWRDYDLEDTLRFYALRLHEADLIKSNPQKLISEHTDWRFLNELKRELKT
jgi:ABC-type nitrate/sulfonate/bicarbonate transport system substrate-binding protein